MTLKVVARRLGISFFNRPGKNMQPHSPSLASDVHALSNEPININEPTSVNYWVTTLRCSELELRMAVAEVGTGARDVGTELGRAV
jgi:hypothetical protein